ncbi:hypothetical protein QLH51_01690 [Sphingomonas sp. 2R-10]|uniref:hypothetical protein n=1 Tax=Sphingomonas sp. 2R-10 TaxID=3045148 RepID=UPI0013DE6359|nr:hypothetical protein [Sphingomonas sp. 2R-10]MDJ0275521.1 hypothetical protein [Sphingomonas sp. 2R-10]
MTGRRILAGIGLGATIAAGLGASPALFAQEQRAPRVLKRLDLGRMPLGSFGGFTPASADPRLAAALSRTPLNPTGFQFTPSEGSMIGSRTIKIAVRSATLQAERPADRVAAVTTMPALNPVAYNLGMASGLKRMALSGDLTRLDVGQPGTREPLALAMPYTPRKLTGRVSAVGDHLSGDQPKMIADASSYSLDAGGSYKLTRNLDVTAGSRYRTDRERMLRVAPERREGQAIYVGTAFRF